MAARSKARKRAVDLLYESDLRGADAVATLAERLTLADPPISDYTVELVEGVSQHRRRIDELLSEYAVDWTIDRMPGVDRAVLRVGLFELLYADDVPDAVAIDEAVELAKSLSTDDSPKFVNGVLGRAVRERQAQQAEQAAVADKAEQAAVADKAEQAAVADKTEQAAVADEAEQDQLS